MSNDILDADFQSGSLEKELDLDTVLRINFLKREVNEANTVIRQARWALIFITVAQLAIGAFEIYNTWGSPSATDSIIGTLIITLFLLVCILWMRVRPMAGLIAGSFIYLGLWILSILLDPSAVYRGILLRIVLVVFLARGIVRLYDRSLHLKELSRLGISRAELKAARRLEDLPQTPQPPLDKKPGQS